MRPTKLQGKTEGMVHHHLGGRCFAYSTAILIKLQTQLGCEMFSSRAKALFLQATGPLNPMVEIVGA